MNVELLEFVEDLIRQRKKKYINFIKVNKKSCLSLHLNADNSYLFVDWKEIFIFKTDNKNVNFTTQFCLRSISNGFSTDVSRERSWDVNVYDVSLDYNSTDESDILNIYKYLMGNRNIR